MIDIISIWPGCLSVNATSICAGSHILKPPNLTYIFCPFVCWWYATAAVILDLSCYSKIMTPQMEKPYLAWKLKCHLELGSLISHHAFSYWHFANLPTVVNAVTTMCTGAGLVQDVPWHWSSSKLGCQLHSHDNSLTIHSWGFGPSLHHFRQLHNFYQRSLMKLSFWSLRANSWLQFETLKNLLASLLQTLKYHKWIKMTRVVASFHC